MQENATAPDSIERILDDAGKSACAHFGFENKPCKGCPSKLISNSCRIAQRIDLVNRTRALCGHQLPEGVEWPRFEDGELVKIGDAYEKGNGRAGTVTNLCFRAYDGVPTWLIGKGGGKLFVKPGDRVKRPERDTQAKIDADAVKGACEYFGWHQKQCEDDGGCPAFIADNCKTAMIRDLLRRQRELCEREAW